MNEIKNRYEYELYDRFGMVEVAPLNEGDFTVDNEQEGDGKYFYNKNFGGKVVFTGAIYQRLKDIEQSMYICADLRMKVFRICAGVRVLIFDGIFHLTDGEWDDDRCQVVVKFEKEKPDRCLDKNKTQKVNLLQEIFTRITVKSSYPGGTIEYKNCFKNSPDPSETQNDYWCGTGDPYEQNWSLVSYTVSSPDGVHNNVNNKWARELVTLNPGETPDPSWVLVSGTTYAKQVQLINCVYSGDYVPDENNGSYNFSQTCEIAGYTGTSTTIDNGVLLSDVINLFKTKFCPDLNVVSDFFQINPENASNINYVTGQATQTNNIVLFQKSDVKRPNATGNASKMEMTFEQLTKMLFTIFNVEYGIYGNVLRFEHFSWFSRTAGLDLTLPQYAKYVKGKRKYSYSIDGIPIKEIWSYKEQMYMGSGEIQYNNLCSSNDKDNTEDYVLDFVTADIQYCLNNPESDSNKVEDAGFVIMATNNVSGQYYIIGGVANSSLTWTNLIPKYHFHNRPLKQGIFNGNTVTFITTKPVKKGEQITVPLPCGTTFDPMNTIKTALGVGIVEKASFRLRDCMLKLDLMYNVFDNLSTNSPPNINGGVLYGAYANTPFYFDIVTSDIDGTVVAIQHKHLASNGIVEIVSLTQAKYTPNPGFTGFDFFGLKAIDDWGESSPTSQGNFGIEVRPPNVPPTATNDNYIVYQEYVPFHAYVSVLANDTDDWGLTLVTTSVTTSQGISITLAADGTFDYTPPAGFVGTDTFQYQIKDDTGATSTGTVFLNVSYQSYPKAINDNYATQKNTVLTIDGVTSGQLKLTANDYTPNGTGGPLFCTAETKATTQGGSVTINTNGTFSYTPPNNFVGSDSFTYTINNTNGSGVGTATIAVVPTIYVKLVQSDQKDYTKPKQNCDGYLTPAGSYKTRDYTLYFYSDAAGTVPIDVDVNWGLRINYRDANTYSGECGNGTYNNDDQTSVVSGISHDLYNDFVYYDLDRYCEGGQCITSIVTSLRPGAYVII